MPQKPGNHLIMIITRLFILIYKIIETDTYFLIFMKMKQSASEYNLQVQRLSLLM